jgi:predicted lipoprotein with Yx(FWY)xxD motif
MKNHLNRSLRRASLVLAVSTALIAGCASMAKEPAMASGGVLTGPNGMTLYTFDKDEAGAGKSVCNGPCATNWPPFMATDSDKPMGNYSVITRDDGSKQWAMKGKPLYYWVKDSKPGDNMGDGFNNVWHAAKPASSGY